MFAIIFIQNDQKRVKIDDFLRAGPGRARVDARNALFWSYVWILLHWRCAWVLGGCVLGNYRSLEAMGPCQTHCKAFKIAKLKAQGLDALLVNSKS